MPNRDLKESNRRSPSLQLLSDGAERLWYRLITAVDDFGRMEADPVVVFTTCFQRVPKGWTVKKVIACLNELSISAYPGDNPLISVYTVGSRTYMQILSSRAHIYQRAKASKYPAPTNPVVSEVCPHPPASARIRPQIPSSPESRVPNPESRTFVSETATRFQEFWHLYPTRNGRKVEKGPTETLFLTLTVQDQSLAVQAARTYAEALKVQGLSAKDPKRFLRGGKVEEPWRDYLRPAVREGPVLNGHGALMPIRENNTQAFEPMPHELKERLGKIGKDIPG